MTKSILIISNKSDITTDLVVKRLVSKNISFFRFNTEDFPTRITSTLRIENSTLEIELTYNSKKIASQDTKSVWYRRPIASDLADTSISGNDEAFARREINELLKNLWSVLNTKLWVNRPHSLHNAERKAFQLKKAVECGLIIAETVFTNDPEVVKNFAKEFKDGVIVKPISHGAYGIRDEYAIYTNEFDLEKNKITNSDMRISPFILQRKITKGVDVRITVIGSHIFAHKILNTNGEIDWRCISPEKLKYEEIELPQYVTVSLLRFMKVCNLKFGAFDFVVDKDGNWTFLEVNPNGQFAWLEILTGTPLIDTLIDLLNT